MPPEPALHVCWVRQEKVERCDVKCIEGRDQHRTSYIGLKSWVVFVFPPVDESEGQEGGHAWKTADADARDRSRDIER